MPAASTAEASALRPKLVEQLQALHAIKSAGLRMFGVMLPAVRRQRDAGSLPEVQDLLERMSNAFGRHEQETREHEQRLRERLAALGAAPSRRRELGLGVVALARGHLGAIGGQNHGANARDAFVFEHLEIACWELLEQLAVRAGDEPTAALARECLAQDDEMAALIRRNFPNVLSLMLASEGLPPMRPPEDAGG